jgi:hypothetical protein
MVDLVTPSAGLDASHRKTSVGADVRSLRALAIGAGLISAILFVVVGIAYQLQSYGDGSIFSYAIAAEDAWAFHSHNIPCRVVTFLFSIAPAEVYVHLTRDAAGGIVVYGCLFFAAQLVGLLATYVIDRSTDRIIFAYACGSTACLCPLVFGFPTETWMAHAAFWPTLALCHYAPRGLVGTAAIVCALLALIFTYEGAVVFAAAIVATLLLRGTWNAALVRAGCAFLAVMALWFVVKATVHPDTYFAVVLARAAWHVFDLTILTSPMTLLLLGALAGYGIVFCTLWRLGRADAAAYSALIVAAALAVYWLRFDHALHAENRYYMRTILLAATPVFGALAAAFASRADGDLVLQVPQLPRLMSALTSAASVRLVTGALVLVMLVHTVEIAKFATAWTHYKASVRALATGTASDSAIGDSHFVSSSRISSDLNRLSWFSTTQFLSVLVAPNFTPTRLVVDPRTQNYFWLTCNLARANEAAERVIPVESRRLVRVHACEHR